jgi:hypothetical protein
MFGNLKKNLNAKSRRTLLVDAARSAAPRAEFSCSPDRDPAREHCSP